MSYISSTIFMIGLICMIFTMFITNGCFFMKNKEGANISNKMIKIWGVVSTIISLICVLSICHTLKFSIHHIFIIITAVPTIILTGILGTIMNMKANQNLELQKKYIKGMGVIMLFFFAPSIIQSLILYTFFGNTETVSPETNGILSLVSNICMAILLIYIYRKDLKEEFKVFKKDFFKNMDNGIKYWMIGLLIMMISNILISILIPKAVAGNENQVREILYATPVVSLISTGILAPFIEEITFRKTFRDMISNNTLFVLISGFIFGALHVVLSLETQFDWFFLIPYCSLGFCFGLIYSKTKSIFTSVTIHMMHNIGSILILLISTMVMILC